MIVETEAAVAFGSGIFDELFDVAVALPGVPCVPPVAVNGPAAFDNLLNNSFTKPIKECVLEWIN